MVLLIAIPNNMEHGIPDSAMEVDDDIKDAMPKPALAVIAERAIPGMMEGGDEEGVGGVCCLLEVDIDENEDEQMKDELCM